jgi:hypothetical protein
MTKIKLKNFLLTLSLQAPLMVVLVFGVHFLTGLSILWCVPIAFVLNVMYDVCERIRGDEDNG